MYWEKPESPGVTTNLDGHPVTPSVESPWMQWTLSGWSIGTQVHGQCPLRPWTMATQSMDIVHSVHGQCPLRPWTMSTESMDNVHSVHGLFPWVFLTLYLVKNYSSPTTLSSVVSVVLTKSRLNKVQWVNEQCPVSPWTQWTLSSPSGLPDCPLNPWTMSIESMDSVHWIHGHCPIWLVSLDFFHGLTGLCPECPWTLSRLSTEAMVNVHWVHGKSLGSPLSPWTFYRWDFLSTGIKFGPIRAMTSYSGDKRVSNRPWCFIEKVDTQELYIILASILAMWICIFWGLYIKT